MRDKARKYQIRILSTMQILDLTQSVHAKISIGMHQGVKILISRIPLIGLETRLGWKYKQKFLNEIKYTIMQQEYGTMIILVYSTLCILRLGLFFITIFNRHFAAACDVWHWCGIKLQLWDFDSSYKETLSWHNHKEWEIYTDT
jgi:hypothetical protein